MIYVYKIKQAALFCFILNLGGGTQEANYY